MSWYINPVGETKEQFLEREGLEVPMAEWKNIPKDSLPVVLINNEHFSAAGIGFCKKRYEYINDRVNDRRPKRLFIVKKDKIRATGVDFPES